MEDAIPRVVVVARDVALIARLVSHLAADGLVEFVDAELTQLAVAQAHCRVARFVEVDVPALGVKIC